MLLLIRHKRLDGRNKNQIMLPSGLPNVLVQENKVTTTYAETRHTHTLQNLIPALHLSSWV